MNQITMQLVADKYIKMALEEDINSEDVTTNAVMPEAKQGKVNLICKEDGIIAGLGIFERVFKILDEKTDVSFMKKENGEAFKDGDQVKKGDLLAVVSGDIRVLLSGERRSPPRAPRRRKPHTKARPAHFNNGRDDLRL